MSGLFLDRRAFTRAALAAPFLATMAQAQPATGRNSVRDDVAAAIAERLHAASPTPALSLAVARPTGLIWSAAYGKTDLELGVDASRDHVFRLGSVSKVVTAVAAVKLASRGVLDLDAPISTWLPDLPIHHRQTTLKQLLTHRGGIRHYLPRDLDPLSPGGAIYQRIYRTNMEILAIFIADPLIAPPGTQVRYSSFGVTLASLVMEAAARRPFTDIVKSEIGATFGLRSLVEDDPIALIPSRATGYSNASDIGMVSRPAADVWYPQRAGGWANIPHSNPAHSWAAGGFLMTPSDTARFGAALLDSSNAQVSAAERALLFTPLTNAPAFGLAWRIDTDATGRRRWHHAGATLGGRASLVIYPDSGLSIALATNVMTLPLDVLGPSSQLADAFV